MHVVASVIARLGSKRLTYKNLLPFRGVPLVGWAVLLLRKCSRIDEIVVSTESELIARVAYDYGAKILLRPPELAEDGVPSIPVFQHIVENFPCDLHLNYNCNFPLCSPACIDEFVEHGLRYNEVLSSPSAIWAQTPEVLAHYPDPWTITAKVIQDPRIGAIDIHNENDLLSAYREDQGDIRALRELNFLSK